jgi:hypothetical protein
MADCCCVPIAFGVAWCLLGGCGGAASVGASSIGRHNKTHPIIDDERPRRMTPYEIEMYNAHMNMYGKTHNY